MTKQQLSKWVMGNCTDLHPKLFNELLSKIDLLKELEPDSIPFVYPVPDGYEVIYENGSIVNNVTMPIGGIVCGYISGCTWEVFCTGSLSLRRLKGEIIKAR